MGPVGPTDTGGCLSPANPRRRVEKYNAPVKRDILNVKVSYALYSVVATEYVSTTSVEGCRRRNLSLLLFLF